MLRIAFAGRRKTVLHSLLQTCPRETLMAAFDAIDLGHASRPEELSLEMWVALFSQLQK
jgi:16S rRNA A1518/A1519 N6-dimethyltransferase RsmA/KsgA/DIM1 with predicted DNA glycosylase/AP lyase activity